MSQVKFTMHDGKEVIASVDSFDAKQIVASLNDRSVEYVAYGNVGFNKFQVKYFEEIVEATPTPTN